MKPKSRSVQNLAKNKSEAKNTIACRLCARNGSNFIDIFVEKNLEIVQIIDKCLNIRIAKGDEYHFICQRCRKKLIEFLEFSKEVEDAQDFFKVDTTRVGENLVIDTIEVPIPLDIKVEAEFEWNDLPIKHESPNQNLVSELPNQTSRPSSPLEDDIKSDNVSDLSESDSTDDDLPLKKSHKSNKGKGTFKILDRDITINNFYNFTCELCSDKMENWQSFYEHMKDNHNEIRPTINCCKTDIHVERRALLAHAEFHIKPEKFQCKLCLRQFSNPDSKRKHEWRHRMAKEGIKKRKATCAVCGKMLSDTSSLRKHMQLHMSMEEKEKLKVQCDLCKRFFRDKVAVSIHIKEMHLPAQKSIACDQCGKSFQNMRSFSCHYKTHHSTNNKVICPDCGLEMKWNSLVKHRQRKHDHEKQFCELCSKEFRNKISLIFHQRRVHVEPKFECDVCGRMFKQKDAMKSHRDGHFTSNRFSCDQCDYVNNDYANMLKHRRTKHPNAPTLPTGTGRKFFQAR